jgi:parallel beta-helix repeat protein
MLNQTSINKTDQLYQSTDVFEPTPKSVVFIDTRVDNFSIFLNGIKANYEVVILDPSRDGIAQITDFLNQHQGTIQSVQILSHGSQGSLQIGGTTLNTSNLDKYQESLQKWFAPTNSSQRPDLILYACNLAEGEVGTNFINQLSQITGADVAASVDPTGGAAKGGNWILEKATGVIEATTAFTQAVKDAYQGILATFTVTNNNDSGPGSLRQAILDANATPGLDNIFFDPAVRLIQPLSPLPRITDPVNLDGRPGQSGTLPGVEINGLNAGTDYNQNSGIQLYGPRTAPPPFYTPYAGADGSTIRGLSITGFWGNGLMLFQTDNNTIEYNHIGTDVTGTVAKGNSRANDAAVYHALLLRGSQNNIIRRNLVSGNFGSGIVLFGSNLGLNGGYEDRNGFFPGTNRNSTNNQILNNIAGLDITGSRALSNQRIGIFVEGQSNLIEGNLVAGNGSDAAGTGTYARGIMAEASPSTSLNTFRNNTAGTNAARTVALPNIITSGSGDIEDAGGAPAINYFQGNSHYGLMYGVPAGPPKDLGGNFQVTGLSITNPTLTAINPQLTTITSNQTINNGDLIDTLVGSSITSTPGRGIAVTAVDNTNGTWEYSTDNGVSWANLQNALDIPPLRPEYGNPWPNGTVNSGVPPVRAVMLAADSKNRIRFVPNVGFAGLVNNGVTYMAWNQAVGGNGSWVNLTPAGRPQVNTLRRGFSMNNVSGAMTTDTLDIQVLPGNAAPVLDSSLVQPLTPIAKNPVVNPGTLVSSLIPGLAVTDPDSGALKGIAVTGVDNTNGTWQYTLDGGTTWLAFGSPSPTSARLLPSNASTLIRFVPNVDYEGTPGISLRAWDQTQGTAGGTFDVTTNGGVTPFSAALGTAAIAVGSAVLPLPPVAPKPPEKPLIDESIVRLLRNPEPPKAPELVVAGKPPEVGNLGGGSLSFLFPLFNLPLPFAFPAIAPVMTVVQGDSVKSAMDSGGCPCGSVIKKQPMNPIIGQIFGTIGADNLFANDSINTIYALDGNDLILGSDGDDNLFGDTGSDKIYGGGGRDFIQGQRGQDTIFGGSGDDVISGGQGRDTLFGEDGNDFLGGDQGNDLIFGGKGDDWLSGGQGNDQLFGGTGNDVLCGCQGDDVLNGGAGDDVLLGGPGNDLLIGGSGNNVLHGGEGADRFRLRLGAFNAIADFEIGVDVLELPQGLRFSDLQIVPTVGGTIVGLNPGTLFSSDRPLAFLAGVTPNTLTPNSFG